MPTKEIKVTECTCSRCAHAWLKRLPNRLPEVCPKCKSRYWNKGRIFRVGLGKGHGSKIVERE